MFWRVEITHKDGIFDPFAQGIFNSIKDLGIGQIQKVEVVLVFHIHADLSQPEIKKVCEELLINCITQDYSFSSKLPASSSSSKTVREIEIAYNPGVMDPVEASTIKGIRDLGFQDVESVHTGKKYRLYGSLSAEQIETIVNKVLANKLIQHVVDYRRNEKAADRAAEKEEFRLIVVDLLNARDPALKELSEKGQLFLNLNEMKAIQKYFKDQERNPVDCELETIAQTWSEHCYHKTFRGDIRYRSTENGQTKTKMIKNLFRSTIAKATEELNKKWCVSVFHDNAGVIKFDDDDHVCFKVETHNHPSALEPFGGANTGIGGVIRDILGTGLGAKPICNTDIFCFAPPDTSFADLPAGTLHPKRIMQGVVSGVRDYGNKMGIPTVNGAVLFDKRFVGNPLVYCGNVGLIPKNKVDKEPKQGDFVVVLGGRTGRDGIHGATFSSGELTHESEVISSGAVQIGNPIEEKKVLDALMKARDLDLYTAITDCGAGGLSSAVGELGKDLGVRVTLEKVPLKYHGLNYTEIWISESQERMVLSVPPKNIEELLQCCNDENVEAAVIGEFTGNHRLELFFKDCQVCDLSMEFLHGGPPKITKEAQWISSVKKDPKFPEPGDLTEKFYEILSDYNVCSKEWIIRQYDHEVQGGSMIKPLTGPGFGPSDAAVVAPKLGSRKAVAIANGINFRFGMIDPYWMAASCIDEAVRQIISVGGDPERIAILDNFCWGNPDKADRLGSLVRAAEGCYKFAVEYGVPYISGKDSLYNEYTDQGKSTAIPGTLLISSIGIIEDIEKTVTIDFKKEGHLIYCVGETLNELGGSIYFKTLDLLGASVPQVDSKRAVKIFKTLFSLSRRGIIQSMHDCSEGGLGVALAEMSFSGGFGAEISLENVPYKGKDKRNDIILFSESNSRLVVEIESKHQKEFERAFKGLPFGLIGQVTGSNDFVVAGINQEVCINTPVEKIKEAWKRPLNF